MFTRENQTFIRESQMFTRSQSNIFRCMMIVWLCNDSAILVKLYWNKLILQTCFHGLSIVSFLNLFETSLKRFVHGSGEAFPGNLTHHQYLW